MKDYSELIKAAFIQNIIQNKCSIYSSYYAEFYTRQIRHQIFELF